jgi:hypothetical protein
MRRRIFGGNAVYFYDNAGEVTYVEDPFGVAMVFAYDSACHRIL